MAAGKPMERQAAIEAMRVWKEARDVSAPRSLNTKSLIDYIVKRNWCARNLVTIKAAAMWESKASTCVGYRTSDHQR
jgi:hypothetical protein